MGSSPDSRQRRVLDLIPRDYIFRIRGMVGKPPVELGFLSVCRTWHGISIADAIPKRLDEFELLFHGELANLVE
jgi:hypothetical protein